GIVRCKYKPSVPRSRLQDRGPEEYLPPPQVIMQALLRVAVASISIALLGLSAARAAEHNTLTKDELAEGWILLFDGQTDFGWKATGKANWKVEGGVISVSEGEPGFLY